MKTSTSGAWQRSFAAVINLPCRCRRICRWSCAITPARPSWPGGTLWTPTALSSTNPGSPGFSTSKSEWFSLLCAALMELEGTVGATPVNRGGLLVSRRHYLQQREMMEGKTWDNKDGFFPAPLWVWVYGTTSDGGKPVIQTRGLDDFGLPELGFFDPERPVNELLDLLYAMSCLQITERQLYRNMALVPLDEKTEAVCKQDGNILLFIGA